VGRGGGAQIGGHLAMSLNKCLNAQLIMAMKVHPLLPPRA